MQLIVRRTHKIKSAGAGAAVVMLFASLVSITPVFAQASLPAGCDLSQVKISNVRTWHERGYARITGILRHSCAGAIGVELKWTGFYADKSVAFSYARWPNGTSNIPANTDFPFQDLQNSSVPPENHTIVPTNIRIW